MATESPTLRRYPSLPIPRSEALNVRKKSPIIGELVVTIGREEPVTANKSLWKTRAVSCNWAAYEGSSVIREAESIINDPLLPCHSRRPGMISGAALANKIVGYIMRKGKRNVKIMPMLSSAIMLKMIVLFFNNVRHGVPCIHGWGGSAAPFCSCIFWTLVLLFSRRLGTPVRRRETVRVWCSLTTERTGSAWES